MRVKETRPSRRSYVVRRNGVYRINGSRVSLDSVVYAYGEGQTPESILTCFPVLTLEQIYGAIAFYLANKTKVDEYLEKGEAQYEVRRQESRAKRPELYAKLARARKQMLSRS